MASGTQKMNSDFTIILLGTFAMTFMITVMFAFAYLYQKKINRKRIELTQIEELLRSEELKSAYALLEGQDKERQRVANDLHDRMGGQLSTLKIFLDLLEGTNLDTKQKELITKLQSSAQTSIEEVRSIAHDMSNSTLNYFGLQKAIEHLCEVISESKKINVTQHIEINVELSTELMRDLYQIIQELITNTLRHAQASKIHLELNALRDGINLIYEDNGTGFDSSAPYKGIGVRSLNMRTERYNGTVIIDSKLGKGTTFIIEIPSV